jgi:hypothetical protein
LGHRKAQASANGVSCLFLWAAITSICTSLAWGPQLARSTAAQALRPWTDRSEVALAADKPDAVLVVGLCGGLKESLPGSRLVLYTECLSTANGQAALECSPLITRRLSELLSSQGMACDAVVGITSARIAVAGADRSALAEFGADVVDMESYEILAAAARACMPAAVLRVVGDPTDQDLPDFNQALNAQGALDGPKALRIALGSPLRTFRLLRTNKRALDHLGKALETVLTEHSCLR